MFAPMIDSDPPPLRGVRVVSLAVNVPGPVAAARLRDLGAEVLRVLPPAGDPLARAAPGWYEELARGCEATTLDLKDPTQRKRFDELLDGADLLLTSVRPAALARLGLSAERFRARHPGLCHVAVIGHAGDASGRAGHDLTFQAGAGLIRPPALPITLAADLAAAERVVSAGLALLIARERGDPGRFAEVAIADAASDLADPIRHGLTAPGAPLGGGVSVYAIHRAREGWVALAALEPHFLARLVAELALPDVAPATLASAFGSRSAEEWERWADERDLPIAAVRRADGEPFADRRPEG
jgi:alpha-methylacyl-CoA racemase